MFWYKILTQFLFLYCFNRFYKFTIVMMANNYNDLTLVETLRLIGFDAAQVGLLMESDLTSFASFRFIHEAGIRAMAKAFAKRTPVARKIKFGMTRIKMMMGVMHLVQDYDCHGVDIDGNTLTMALELITEGLLNAQICKHHADNKEVASKAADPGVTGATAGQNDMVW
jgi:hypothetical protein